MFYFNRKKQCVAKMSLMKLFGGGAEKKQAPTPQQSIDKLRQTLELLEKREAYLETKITKEIQEAKENATKNKRSTCPLPLASPFNLSPLASLNFVDTFHIPLILRSSLTAALWKARNFF